MEMEFDLKKIFSLLLQKLRYIVIIAALAGFVALGYTKFFITPIYSSSAKFLVIMDDTGSKASEATFVNEAIYSYLEIFNTGNFFREVAEDFNIENDTSYTSNQIKSMTTIKSSSSQNTPSFTVQVSSANPQLSYDLANLVAEHMKNTSEEYKVLNEISLIDDPVLPVVPSSPNVMTNTILACFVGGVLAASFFVIIMMLDKKVKTLEDITSRYNLPILGIVPDSNPATVKMHTISTKEER